MSVTDEQLDALAKALIPALERIADIHPKAPTSPDGRHGWTAPDDRNIGKPRRRLMCAICGGPLADHSLWGCAA